MGGSGCCGALTIIIAVQQIRRTQKENRHRCIVIFIFITLISHITTRYIPVDSIISGKSNISFFTSDESKLGLLCAASLPIVAKVSICFILVLL